MALRGQKVGRATTPARSPVRASIASAAFAGAALVAAACSTTKAHTTASTTTQAESPSGATSTTGAAATAAAGCTLPLTHDALDGFHIGVPSGWDLFTFNSTIVVSKDPSLNTEETNVTPVLMTPGLTPASVFTSSLSPGFAVNRPRLGAGCAKTPSWWAKLGLLKTLATRPGGHFSGEA